MLTPLDPNSEAPEPDALYLALEGVLAQTLPNGRSWSAWPGPTSDEIVDRNGRGALD